MKIAISSKTNSIESNVDPRFGRCPFFAIYDTESTKLEFLINPGREAQGGAGPIATSFVANQKAEKVFSGAFGAKINSLFDELKIQMIVVTTETTIKDIIEKLKNNLKK